MVRMRAVPEGFCQELVVFPKRSGRETGYLNAAGVGVNLTVTGKMPDILINILSADFALSHYFSFKDNLIVDAFKSLYDTIHPRSFITFNRDDLNVI